jgi:two-component system response regulator TctD
MRLLLVEDNPELAHWLARALRAADFVIDHLSDGAAADRALASESYDLVILDLALPKMDGLEVLGRLRTRGQTVPVLILTARGETDDRIKGLNLGADDYLAKPFELGELEARIKALLRRAHRAGSLPEISCGALAYDTVSRMFTVSGAPLALTPREHSVLEALITRAGQAVAKERLFAQVFSLDDNANVEAIELYVHRVRRKLEGSGVAITTLRGLGYLLEVAPDG